MNKTTYEANKEIRYNLFELDLQEFKNSTNKESLQKKYKEMMRFLLIITRDIAISKNELDFANFIDSIIKIQTKEIHSLNIAFENNKINELLDSLSFHDKINIICYVNPLFYNYEYDNYEILNDEVIELLSKSIIEEANLILKSYNTNLYKIKKMNVKDVYVLLKDNQELVIDILYATECIKKEGLEL